jgi:hypothetical protein
MLLDKRAHQLLALSALNINHLNAVFAKVLLATMESLVLTKNDAGDFVQYASSGTHIARRERGIHSTAGVGGSW